MKRIYQCIIGLCVLTSLTIACTDLNEIPFINLKVDFVPLPSVVQLGTSIEFVQNSTIVARSFQWDFGDQTTSTESSPSHTYQTPGRYDVKMLAIKPDGITQDSITKQVVVLPQTQAATNTITFGDINNPNSEEFGLTFSPYLFETEAGFVFVGRKDLNTLQVIRTDANLNPLWTQNYNNIADGRGQITPQDVSPTSDNGFVIVGYFQYSTNEKDAFITKIDSAGNELWTNLTSTQRDEEYNAVTEIAGSFLIGGTTGEISNEGNLIPKISITSYDLEGNLQISFTQGSNWIINDFEFANDRFILAVTEGGRPKIFEFNPSFTELRKYEIQSNGRTFRGRALGVAEVDGGDLILVGEKTYEDEFGNPLDSTTAFMAKVDESGTQEWIIDTIAFFRESLYDIVEGANGDLYAVGTHENPITGKDIIVIKYANDGTLNNARLIGGMKDEEAFEMTIFPNDQIMIFGTTQSFGSGLRDFYILNLDANLE